MVYKVLGNTLQNIERKKQILDSHRPMPAKLIENLLNWFRIELAYSSNAIEGNTLSKLETAAIVENGITIGGKLLKEHLEAINHANAFDFIVSLAKEKTLDKRHILQIHKLVLTSIEDQYAGRYRDIRVRISGTDIIFPNPLKVPELIADFIAKINSYENPIHKAINAHYELFTIHPFIDENGRTARLLMNLILIQNGFAPAIIKPRNRLKYLKSLEKAQLGGSKDDYESFMLNCIDRSMDIYLNALENKESPKITPKIELIKIGKLAKDSSETIATLRHWIKLGLIEVSATLESGYQLFEKSEIQKCFRIRELQKQRLTLEEIARELG